MSDSKPRRFTKKQWIAHLQMVSKIVPAIQTVLEGSARDSALRSIGTSEPFESDMFYPSGFYESYKVGDVRYDLVYSTSKLPCDVVQITPIDWESRIKDVELSKQQIYTLK